MTPLEFCTRHNACPEGRDWAAAFPGSLAEAFATCPPNFAVWAFTRPGVLTKPELVRFAEWCTQEARASAESAAAARAEQAAWLRSHTAPNLN